MGNDYIDSISYWIGKKTQKINVKDIDVGDYFIKGDSPRHVVMIVEYTDAFGNYGSDVDFKTVWG